MILLIIYVFRLVLLIVIKNYIAQAEISSPGRYIVSALCFSSPFWSFSRDYQLPTRAPHMWDAKTLPRRTAPHRGTILWQPPTSPPTRHLRSSVGIWLQSWRWEPARYTWGRKLSVLGPGSVVAPPSCSISPGSGKDSFLHLTSLTCFFKVTSNKGHFSYHSLIVTCFGGLIGAKYILS